ncbi:ABC transporter permease [Candidatus Neomarinimicrobiota bacterium]
MFKFLFKGIWRDKSRSLFSVIIVAGSVGLVLLYRGLIAGVFDDMLKNTAVLMTGHTKVMTKAYAEEAEQMPNDLALVGVDEILADLNTTYPDMFWSPRIMFGGLLDIPDENGETRSQGPMMAFGVDLLSEGSRQAEIWDLDSKVVEGRQIADRDEILLSAKFAERLDVKIGETATFMGSTMHGSFTTYNFKIVGLFALGMGSQDDMMSIVDIEGARMALDMEDSASEIMGFWHNMRYPDEFAVTRKTEYNETHDGDDVFGLTMQALRDQNLMGTMVDFAKSAVLIILTVFMTIVMVVLWNLGLMNGLRRYGEIGIRLALGESKGHVYRSMIAEAAMIGVIGTIVGSVIGISLTYWMQEVGLDYSEMMETLNYPMTAIMRGQVTPDLFYLGFFPGVGATVLGTMLAGRGIYKREMAQLFKELET